MYNEHGIGFLSLCSVLPRGRKAFWWWKIVTKFVNSSKKPQTSRDWKPFDSIYVFLFHVKKKKSDTDPSQDWLNKNFTVLDIVKQMGLEYNFKSETFKTENPGLMYMKCILWSIHITWIPDSLKDRMRTS